MAVEVPGYEPTEEKKVGPPQMSETHRSISVEEAFSIFDPPIENITRPELIQDLFQRQRNEQKITISIPLDGDLDKYCKELNRAIFGYTGLPSSFGIGGDIRGIIAEAVSDLYKHARNNGRYDKILVSVSKSGNDLAVRLLNPADPSVDLEHVDQAHNDDPYSTHGGIVSPGLEKDLLERGCKKAEDTSLYIAEREERVGVLREILISLPEQ